MPKPLPLPELVTTIDEGLQGSTGPVVIKLTTVAREIEIGIRPLPAWDPPLEALLGFTAPATWQALGLHCVGHAYRFEQADRLDLGSGYTFDRSEAEQKAAVTFTVMLDRDGNGAGVLRVGQMTAPLPFPPEGVLGDSCRRALGLPTSPPPPGTVELWLRVWLDRLIDAVAFLGADRYREWDSVLSLHPVATASAHCPVGGPVALADATRRLAEAWPWSRLRREPDIVEVPQPPLDPDVTAWMDDGMYARWTLSSLPSVEELAAAVENVLPADVSRKIVETLRAAGVAPPVPVRSAG